MSVRTSEGLSDIHVQRWIQQSQAVIVSPHTIHIRLFVLRALRVRCAKAVDDHAHVVLWRERRFNESVAVI